MREPHNLGIVLKFIMILFMWLSSFIVHHSSFIVFTIPWANEHLISITRGEKLNGPSNQEDGEEEKKNSFL